jgi:hypothetical protein
MSGRVLLLDRVPLTGLVVPFDVVDHEDIT